MTYRRFVTKEYIRLFGNRTNALGSHSGESYELQLRGPTIFTVLEGPDSGDDTSFTYVKEAYRRFSPAMQERLQGFIILHTSVDQVNGARQCGIVERPQSVSNTHSLIRFHPVTTKERFIYVTKGFSKRIVESKQQETQALLDFLCH